MPINFFDVGCKTKSNKTEFGLCDDPPPAYIDENNNSKWIAFVSNPENKDVDFYAIDHCINIYDLMVKWKIVAMECFIMITT